MAVHRSRRNKAARAVADLLLVIAAIIALGALLWFVAWFLAQR